MNNKPLIFCCTFAAAGLCALLLTGASGVNSIFRFPDWKLSSFGSGQFVKFHDANTLTNVAVARLLYQNTVPIVSAGSSGTNMMSYTVPGGTLTRNGDYLDIFVTGDFASGAGSSVGVNYGSEILQTSPSTAGESGSWMIHQRIVYSGATAQMTGGAWIGNDNFAVGSRGAAPRLAQTNSIDTVLQVRATASVSGNITNTCLIVALWNAP